MPISDSVSASDTIATILEANKNVNGIQVFNEGPDSAYYAFGNNAVAGKGGVLPVNTGVVLKASELGELTIKLKLTVITKAGLAAEIVFHNYE